MKDPRIAELAKILIDYSGTVKKGDTVLIEFNGAAPLPLVTEMHALCLKRGVKHVEVNCQFREIDRSFYDNASDEQLDFLPRHDLNFMKKVDVYFAIRAQENSMTLASVPTDRVMRRGKALRPISIQRVRHTRWCVLAYPTEGMAQDANMSLEELEDFIFGACLRDWKKVSKSMAKLERLLTKTKEVRLVASDTDLSFRKKGLAAVKCDGKYNMPDGEVFTAPEKKTVEGYITYNAPSVYQGREYNGVRLEFEKGKIVKATCEVGEQSALDAIFDTDPGARYIGEFAIGVNQGIQRPMKSILFDEKIGGSIHLTPGSTYDECDNGNRSAVHWDLVKILKGDGEIYFDGKLIQKNGKFVTPELKALNR